MMILFLTNRWTGKVIIYPEPITLDELPKIESKYIKINWIYEAYAKDMVIKIRNDGK